jgi:hypothetical protein
MVAPRTDRRRLSRRNEVKTEALRRRIVIRHSINFSLFTFNF